MRPRATAAAFCSMATGMAGSFASAIVSVAKPVSFGYALTCAIAFVAQRKLQYFPGLPAPEHPAVVSSLFEGVEEFSVTAADGTQCVGWHWPAPPSGSQPAAPWWLGPQASAVGAKMGAIRAAHPELSAVDVLLFHGNAGHRGDRLGWAHILREGLGVSVTIIDYRGYGGSDGAPTEAGLIQDAQAAAKWLKQRQKHEPCASGRRGTVYWGESIGSGVAVACSVSDPPDAIVIEAGFTSCADIGAAAYPWLPVKLLMFDQFDSATRSKSLQALPCLSLHGTDDDIAPIQLGRKLFDELPSPKRFVELPCGHNDVMYSDPARYLAEVSTFLVEQVVARRSERSSL